MPPYKTAFVYRPEISPQFRSIFFIAVKTVIYVGFFLYRERSIKKRKQKSKDSIALFR
jgi:hypothetical protein